MSKVVLVAVIAGSALTMSSRAHALVETAPEIEVALALTLAPASLAVGGIIVNSIELAVRGGAPPYATTIGLLGGLVALAGCGYGLSTADEFFGEDRERAVLIATAISAAFATSSIILAIIGWANYEPEASDDPPELALSIAPAIGAHEGSVVVVGGF